MTRLTSGFSAEIRSTISRGPTIPSGQFSHDNSAGPPDLLLLFPRESRPDATQIRNAVSLADDLTISAEDNDGEWMELLSTGLTFDCSGFAPGPARQVPPIRHWVAGGEAVTGLDAVGIGLGRHIRAGQGMIPILRVLLGVASRLTQKLDGCLGVNWLASGLAVHSKTFIEMVERFDGTGPMPMALLLATEVERDGALATTGLRYFTGQELSLEPGIGDDQGQRIILAQRIAAQLVHRGQLEAAEESVGPDGTVLCLSPAPDGTRVIVRAG